MNANRIDIQDQFIILKNVGERLFPYDIAVCIVRPANRTFTLNGDSENMALYALGDMHLAFSVDKPMDIFGKVWRNHEQKLEKNCRKLIGNEDTFVITGDHS